MQTLFPSSLSLWIKSRNTATVTGQQRLSSSIAPLLKPMPTDTLHLRFGTHIPSPTPSLAEAMQKIKGQGFEPEDAEMMAKDDRKFFEHQIQQFIDGLPPKQKAAAQLLLERGSEGATHSEIEQVSNAQCAGLIHNIEKKLKETKIPYILARPGRSNSSGPYKLLLNI